MLTIWPKRSAKSGWNSNGTVLKFNLFHFPIPSPPSTELNRISNGKRYLFRLVCWKPSPVFSLDLDLNRFLPTNCKHNWNRQRQNKLSGSLSTSLFETRTATGRENFACSKVLSSRFLNYSSLMGKRYLAMWMWLCEDKLKVKTAHFSKNAGA